MKSLEELFEETESDLKLIEDDLVRESLRTPYLYDKYLKEYTLAGLELKRLENDYNELFMNKTEYYLGKSSKEVYDEKPFDRVVIRSELPTYLDADSELRVLNEMREYASARKDFLSRTLTGITNRQWNIKNAIEWNKFLNGAV
ncbi:MAG: hypothetical protein CL489_16470 [Acidobacteria bacterium]|jgi:hypothetical protein|nr:hypothetical protein [Acidobacteriota bacterium]|tara:strand:+ start:492 stop:923 length:432 start_codon:yes stop_codon:yes gene_type:complete